MSIIPVDHVASRRFSAWREGAAYYLPPLVLGGGLMATPYWGLGTPVFVVGLFVLYFFRDPARQTPAAASAVVSPADGTVVGVEDLGETEYYDGPCKRVSIFLSVLNVHVNRAPEDGTVREVLYRPGKYVNAMRPDSSRVNESNAIYLDTPHGPMTVRQISGAVARRIVCAARPGDAVLKGERIGMIKFGSRTELYLPADAEVCVGLKEKVKGGTTVIARFATGSAKAVGTRE